MSVSVKPLMDYKDTLNLPKTAFPMKANLPKLEPEWLERWDGDGHLRADPRRPRPSRPLWILHDGPPYANGHIHMGTALNKILKDLVVKSRSMLGLRRGLRAGLGLPRAAHRAPGGQGAGTRQGVGRRAPGDGSAREAPPLPRVRGRVHRHPAARSSSGSGVFGDWDNPYLTMAPAYEAAIAREFGRFVGRGLVYKGLKPVHWCMHCKTALAQAEVEYEEQTHAVGLREVPAQGVPRRARPRARRAGRPRS